MTDLKDTNLKLKEENTTMFSEIQVLSDVSIEVICN